MSIRWLGLILMMAISTSIKAENILHKDPFLQPDLSLINNQSEQATTPISRKLKLRGTLRSGTSVLANINGTIMAIGDELDGFKLISVTEHSATLENNNEQLELLLENYTNNGREQ